MTLQMRADLHAPVLVDARALRAIEAEMVGRALAARVETGGLLVGPPGTRTVLDFLPSGPAAHRASHFYRTDPAHLQRALDACHSRHGGDVLGYAHSHPTGILMPSHQDLAEAARMLADPDYRSMTSEVLLPIAQVHLDRGPEARHVVELYWYVYRRDGSLLEVAAHVVPHWEAVEALDAQLRGEGFTVEQRGLAEEGLALVARGAREDFVWVLPPAFPDEPPRLFRLEGDEPVDEVEVPAEAWRPLPPAAAERCPTPSGRARVVATDRAWAEAGAEVSVTPFFHADGRVTHVVTPGGPVRLEADASAGLVLDVEGDLVEVTRVPFATDFGSRSAGLVDPGHLAARRVALLGCGSVGSPMAEQLVRAGVGGLTLVDPDVVSVSNLARSTYGLADVGRPKVGALAEALRRVNPHVALTTHACDFTTLDEDALASGHDLLVVAVDRPTAIRIANAQFHARRPVVYPGVYEMGQGGEVLITRPGGPCLECVLREVRFGDEPPPVAERWDYSSADGRLKAEPALVAQIQHVVSAAVLVALGVLSEGTDTEMARLLDPAHQAVFMANQRGWIFDYPLQAVWASFERRADCACAADAT